MVHYYDVYFPNPKHVKIYDNLDKNIYLKLYKKLQSFYLELYKEGI